MRKVMAKHDLNRDNRYAKVDRGNLNSTGAYEISRTGETDFPGEGYTKLLYNTK